MHSIFPEVAVPINFDMEEFRKCLREQFDYILKNEANLVLKEALSELVKKRLEEFARKELNILGEETEGDFSSSIKQLAQVQMHISSLDIDHRGLVRDILKEEMKNMLQGFINENLK